MEFSGELFSDAPAVVLCCPVRLVNDAGVALGELAATADADQFNVFSVRSSVCCCLDAAHRDPARFNWHLPRWSP